MSECKAKNNIKIKGIFLPIPNTEFEEKLEQSDNMYLSYNQRGEKFKGAIEHLKANPNQGVYFASMEELDKYFNND